MTEPTLPLGADVWDLDRLRLPAERVGNLETRRRPPRHWPGDPFIKGPIPYAWIASACRLPGAGLPVAIAYRFLCCRYRWRNRWGLDAIAKACGSLPTRPDAASFRPSWPGCWPSIGSRVASWRSPSWISRSRKSGRSVGRCMVRSLGVGGSRPPDSRGGLFKLHPSVGSWRVGAGRPVLSDRSCSANGSRVTEYAHNKVASPTHTRVSPRLRASACADLEADDPNAARRLRFAVQLREMSNVSTGRLG